MESFFYVALSALRNERLFERFLEQKRMEREKLQGNIENEVERLNLKDVKSTATEYKKKYKKLQRIIINKGQQILKKSNGNISRVY